MMCRARGRDSLIILWLLLVSAGNLGASQASSAQATPAPPADPSPCLTDLPPPGSREDEHALATGLPSGFVMDVLATADVDRLPASPAFLQLTRLTLEPGAGSETRLAGGPILYYVLSGMVTVYVDGTPAVVEPARALLVPSASLYALANESDGESIVFRLALVPQTDDGQIMVMPTAESVLPIPPSSTPQSEPLYSAEITMLPAPGARLFLACVEWEAADAALGDRAFPGPVGLRVERGQIRIDDALTLDVGGCSLIEGSAVHRIAASAELPVVLVFGVIPAGAPLWASPTQATVGPPPAPERLRCGG
ncbi:MAG: hypothetical protein KatS3mg059_1014 [Thermomicrobiales bacterium]|nr:MAG: hypothetical protein KatS3mg059_1014 [Thermomicrobiales bacterium]